MPPVPSLFENFVGRRMFDAEWTHQMVSELHELSPEAAQNILGSRLAEVTKTIEDILIKDFPVGIDWQFFQKKDQSPDQVTIGGSFLGSEQQPLGFFIFSLNLTKKEAELDFMKLDKLNPATKGLFKPWFNRYTSALQALRIEREVVSADWSGRLVWGLKGYDFDPSYHYIVDGQTVSQAQGIRGSFYRFLQEEKISVEDLILEKQETRRSVSADDLLVVSNYAYIKHKDGKKIKLAPNFDFRRFDFNQTEQDVGVAFALGYYGAGHSEPVVFINADGFPVSSIFMPGWKGIRHFTYID